MRLLELFVELSARGFDSVDSRLERTESKAQATDKALTDLRTNAARGAEFKTEAKESGFKTLLRTFANTRRNAQQGATFETRSEQRGFGEARSEMRQTRAQAASGASFETRATESGFAAVLRRIAQARASTAHPATFEVRGQQSGLARIVSSIARARENAQRGATFNLRTDAGGIASTAAAISGLRMNAARGATLPVRSSGVPGVMAQFAGLERARAALSGKTASVVAAVRGAPAAIAQLMGVNRAASVVDGRNATVNVGVRGVAGAIAGMAAMRAATGALSAALIAGTTQGVDRFNKASLFMGNIASYAGRLGILGLVGAFGPLVGMAGVATSAVASVGAGFGLLGLAAIPTMRALSGEAGRLTASQQRLKDSAKGFYAAFERAFAPATRRVEELATATINYARGPLNVLGRTAKLTADAVGRAGTNMRRQFENPQQLALFNQFLSRVPNMTRLFTQAAGQFGLGVFNMLVAAQPVAERFLGWLNKITLQFSRWSASAEGQRQLRQFFEASAPVARALANAIGAVTAGLFKLTTNPAVIGFFTKLLNAIGFIGARLPALTPIFAVLNRIAGAFASLPVPIRSAITVVGLFSATILTLVGGPLLIFGSILLRLASGFRVLGGAARLVTGPFSRLGPLFARLGPVLARVGGFLARPMAAFRALGGIFARIVPLVARFAPWLARIGVAALGLSNPIGWIITGITLLATAFVIAYRRSERFRNIVNSIGRFLQRLAQGALRLTVAGLRMLGNALRPVIAWIGRAAVAVGKFAARLAVGTIRTYVRVLGAIWRAVRPVIVWLGKAALAIGRFAARLAVGTIRTYVRVLGAIWRAVRPVIVWLGKAAVAVGRFVGRLAVGALRLFGRMLTALWRAAKPVLVWMGRAAVAVGRFVGRLAVRALRLFGRFLGVLWRAVKPVIAWLGRAAVAVGKFLARLVIKGLRQWGRWLRSIWNAAKPVVTWLGKAAIAVGKFLARLAVKALRNFWRGLKTIWNGAKTLISWIGKGARAVGNFATRVFNAAKNMRGTWGGFWKWAKKLWNNSLGAIWRWVKGKLGDIWGRVKRNAANVLGIWTNFWNKRVKPLFRNSLGALFKNVKQWGINTWERFKRIAGNIFGIWRNFYNKRIKPLFKTSLSDLFGNVKAWGINTWERFKRIAGNIFGIWKNFYNKRIKPLFKNSLGDLFGNVKRWGINTWERFKRIAGNIFDIWKNFWNKRIKPLFSGSFGDLTDAAKKWATNFIKPFGRAVNKIRQWLGGLATALANVLSALGMDKFAKNLRGRAGKLKAPLTFARGGIARAKDGPGIVAEAGDDEAVVNLRKKTPESQRAFRAAQDSPNAPQHNRGGRPPTNAPNVTPGYPPPHGAHSHDHEQLSRSELRHKQQGVRGAHPDFSRNHKNVYDYVRDRANKAAGAASGVSWNTYHHHITSPGANENSSVDFWGGAPGRAIGKSKGDRVADYVRNNLAKGNLGTIWNRKFSRGGGPFRPWSGGPHTNHVHVGWSTDKNAKIVSGGGVGGAFSGVMDALGNAYNSVTDFISQKFKPDPVPDLGGGPFFSGLAEGLKSSILGRATDWITDKASEMLSIGSSGSGSGEYASGKTLREWARNGLTHGGVFEPNEDNVRRTAEQAQIESGGNPKAANNWDINAIRGNPSKGLMQVIKTTWNANTTPGIGGFDANWDDPVKSVAVASRYVASRYGKIANIWPTRGGYDRGGVIPGTPGEPRVIRAHAGERVLPASLARGFEVLARALDRFSALGRGSALERVAQALTRALGGSRGLRVQRPARNRQHRAPRRTLSQRVRAWNDQPDAQRFRKGVPDELERDARAAGYSLAEDLTFVRSGFYGNARTQRPRVQPRTNRLPVNSAQVARNVQINAGMSTAALEREIQGLKNDLVQTLNNNAAKPTFIGNWVEGERTMLNSQRSKAGREVQRQNAEDEVNRKLNRMR